MLEWIGIGAATFVGGGALWLVQRSARRNDQRLDETVTDEICQTRMAGGEQRFTAIDRRLDRLDGRVEDVRTLTEKVLFEVKKINGRGGHKGGES